MGRNRVPLSEGKLECTLTKEPQNYISHFCDTELPCLKIDSSNLILADLKVLRRSPDLLNNVKIGQGQLQLNGTNFVLPYIRVSAILVK